MTLEFLPTVAPVLAILLTIAAAGFHVAARERRQVGPGSDRGIGLNVRSPDRLDSFGASVSNPSEGAER